MSNMTIFSTFSSSKNNVKDKRHQCDICSKTFTRPNHVINHKRSVHKIILPPTTKTISRKYTCHICEKSFTLSNNRRKHERKFHNFFLPLQTNVICQICEFSFTTVPELQKHIIASHKQELKPEELKFTSLSEFKHWKDNIERDTTSSYILTTFYTTKSHTVQTYSCHRSGCFKSRSKGVRNMKLNGTNKIGSICPANLRVEINKENDSILVKHFPMHLGHEFEVERLRLSRSEKDIIAGELYAGMSASSILDKIADTAVPAKRFAKTNVQDIRNISVSYGLDATAIHN